MDTEILKTKQMITRQDIADLLASIGKPGEKHDEKYAAVVELEKQNSQGVKLEDSLASYEQW